MRERERQRCLLSPPHPSFLVNVYVYVDEGTSVVIKIYLHVMKDCALCACVNQFRVNMPQVRAFTPQTKHLPGKL